MRVFKLVSPSKRNIIISETESSKDKQEEDVWVCCDNRD